MREVPEPEMDDELDAALEVLGLSLEEERAPYGGPGFESLLAWQKARALAHAVNLLADASQFGGPRAFRDQLQRAAVSVMSNIAEGYERGGRNEFFHMLGISKGSCGEVRSLLYVAFDAGYINKSTFEQLQMKAIECSRIIAGLRKSVAEQRTPAR